MMTKPERILDDWPTTAAETLLVLERYYHLSRKFAHQYDFSLTLFMWPVSQQKVIAVVEFADKLVAADEQLAEKINRW